MRTLDSDIAIGILDALDMGVIVLDREGRVAAWNAWMSTASAIGAEAARGRTLGEIFPGAELRRLVGAVADTLESGTSSLLTHMLHPALLPLRTPTGRDLVHNTSVRPLGPKPFQRCVVQVVDVTGAAHREQVLRERQNARYDAAVNNAPDAILTLDHEGTIQLANPAAAREFGYAPSELLGRPITLLLGEEGVWRAVWDDVVRGAVLQGAVEVVGRRKDGSPSHLEISASRWFNHSRIFVTVILRDVNERRAAEEALRSLNQTLELRVAERTADRDRMWRLSTDLMLVARLDSTITAVNPAWTALLGWTEDDLIGRRLIDLVHPDDAPDTVEKVGRLAEGLPTPRFENRIRHRDGSYRWLSWASVPDEGLVHALARDITGEKAQAEALARTEEQLRQSQKMEAVGQLTGGIAHDFNNLLAGIIGSLELMQTRLGQGRLGDLPRYIGAAMTSAERASSLTHRLLAFSRRQPLDPRPVDANGLVVGMEDLLRRTIGPAVALEMVLPEGVWRTRCDAVQLESAILNLCINARDAMPDGGRLSIETSNLDVAGSEADHLDLAPGQYVVISVSDTGTGMPSDVMARAFDPFFTTKPIGQGTGLGLSMVYGFAKQSEGQVRIHSEPGRGTRVRIHLPRHQGRAEDDGAAAPADAEPRAGAGETVLVVEDDAVVRDLVVEVLGDLGYRTIEAEDAPGGLMRLGEAGPIDLLVTDLGLPGMNGRQLADLARATRPGLRVLFITGYAESATLARGFLEPGMGMITKPFAVDALARKIRQMLGVREGVEAAPEADTASP